MQLFWSIASHLKNFKNLRFCPAKAHKYQYDVPFNTVDTYRFLQSNAKVIKNVAMAMRSCTERSLFLKLPSIYSKYNTCTDLGEGPEELCPPPLFWRILQNIYKKNTEMSIQMLFSGPLFPELRFQPSLICPCNIPLPCLPPPPPPILLPRLLPPILSAHTLSIFYAFYKFTRVLFGMSTAPNTLAGLLNDVCSHKTKQKNCVFPVTS